MTLMILVSMLAAGDATTTRYKVMLSLFGKIGEAAITVAERDGRYIMVVEDHATGLAAAISGNERDRFVSRGRIVEGRYVTDTFELCQVNNKAVETNVYLFDHDAKTVTRIQDKNETVTETEFSAINMRFEEKTYQKITKERKVLDFYSEYDALSVVLNVPRLVESCDVQEIFPVGLAKKDRRIILSRPNEADVPELLEVFHYPTIMSLVQLDSIEVKNDDEYGVLIGYNDHGGVDEVVTKETYFLIGFGRIEKIHESKIPADEFFDRQSSSNTLETCNRAWAKMPF